MKKTIIRIACVLSIIGASAYGDKECMSFEHDPYAEDNDYHTLHNVECYCPCKNYKRLPHGQCSYCGHYRYPNRWYIRPEKPSYFELQSKKMTTVPDNVVDEKLYQLFGQYRVLNPGGEPVLQDLE